jgi:uncharacterized surface protein with fasciclin (FAS1) repeats
MTEDTHFEEAESMDSVFSSALTEAEAKAKARRNKYDIITYHFASGDIMSAPCEFLQQVEDSCHVIDDGKTRITVMLDSVNYFEETHVKEDDE